MNKKGNNVQKKKSKNFLNFLLEPSRSKMDHKKAINENGKLCVTKLHFCHLFWTWTLKNFNFAREKKKRTPCTYLIYYDTCAGIYILKGRRCRGFWNQPYIFNFTQQQKKKRKVFKTFVKELTPHGIKMHLCWHSHSFAFCP